MTVGMGGKRASQDTNTSMNGKNVPFFVPDVIDRVDTENDYEGKMEAETAMRSSWA